MDIKIAVAYHKPSLILKYNNFIPIQVGKANNLSLDLGIQCDDIGDNISIENGYYCELTALYWLWKNVTADVKGLLHYRRIFDSENTLLKRLVSYLRFLRCKIYAKNYFPYNFCLRNEYVSIAESFNGNIPQIIANHDIIASKKCKLNLTVKDFFSIIDKEYLLILQRVVQELNPNYYDTYISSLEMKDMHMANMIVMRNILFDEYCSFLFSSLDKVKDILLKENYILNLRNERIFNRKLGYLGELLTNTFILKKKSEGVKVKEMPIAFFEQI